MLLPSIFGESLLDDWMDFPDMRDFGNIEKKLYGKNAAHIMKTDVHEHDEGFELDIDLPGFKKEEIQLDLENGYLMVSAAKGLESDEKNQKTTYVTLFGIEKSREIAAKLSDEAIAIWEKQGESCEFLLELTKYLLTRTF